jgi:HprK-related kinase A
VKLGELAGQRVSAQLRRPGLALRVGPFVTHVETPIRPLADALHLLYRDFDLADPEAIIDFHIRVAPPRGPRRWWRPQCVFFSDGRQVFQPFPLRLALPLLEWGWNWCVSQHAHSYLIVHCAVVEREGVAALLPAPPGAGKSTLCAGLMHRGWRLLSDELALVRLDDRTVAPLPRPVSLKGVSIDVIRRFVPGVVIGPVSTDTHKGTVAHLRPPADQVAQDLRRARVGWVIFPRYEAGAPARLTPVPRSRAFLRVVESVFNYSVLGRAAFETLAHLVDQAGCYEFAYGDLGEAADVFRALVPGPVAEVRQG